MIERIRREDVQKSVESILAETLLRDGSRIQLRSKSEQTVDIIAISPTGKEIDFHSLADVEFDFVTGHMFGANAFASRQMVMIPEKGFMESPRDIMSTLHEIGHLRAVDANGGYRDAYAVDAEYAYRSRHDSVQDMQRVVRYERDAWAEALYAARELREQGVDVFSCFDSMDDLSGWLRSTGLRTYEYSVEQHGLAAYTRNHCVLDWRKKAEEGNYLLSRHDIEALTFLSDLEATSYGHKRAA
jgi:hypothetical protein